MEGMLDNQETRKLPDIPGLPSQNRKKRRSRKPKKPFRLTKAFRNGVIIFLCAVLAAVILPLNIGIYNRDIVLPLTTRQEEGVQPVEKTDILRTDAVITVKNVQQVIASLVRPTAYSANVANTLYWNGNWESINATQYVRDGVCLTEFLDANDRVVRYDAFKNGLYYAWRNGGDIQYSGAAGMMSADDTSMIPTYEMILQTDPKDIVAAGERTISGESCIYVTVKDEATGYSLTYWVSSVTGLLVQADYNRDGKLVRSVVINDISRSKPAESLYLLPNGQSLLDVQE